MILFDETIRQKNRPSIPELISKHGAVGIKVDKEDRLSWFSENHDRRFRWFA